MVPGHSGLSLEATNPKATLVTTQEGDTLMITLSSQEQFKGFLIVVQDKDEKNKGSPIGEFVLTGKDMQGVRCKGANTGVTHTSSSKKSSVAVNWKIPSGLDKVLVRATLIYDYSRGEQIRKVHAF